MEGKMPAAEADSNLPSSSSVEKSLMGETVTFDTAAPNYSDRAQP
jgi:hypothetical protein